MDMSLKDTIDLLRKWQTENRVVHCIAISGGIQIKILGRIDSVNENTVHISQTKTTTPLGDRTFVSFPLRDFAKLEYSDAVHMTQLAISKIKGHDALLTITYRSGAVVGLDVLSPLDELVEL